MAKVGFGFCLLVVGVCDVIRMTSRVCHCISYIDLKSAKKVREREREREERERLTKDRQTEKDRKIKRKPDTKKLVGI